MATSESTKSKKIGVRLWMVFLPLVLVAAAVIAMSSVYLFFVLRDRQSLEAYSRELSALQSSGLPMTPAAFEADYESKTEWDEGIWAEIDGELNDEAIRAKVAGVPYFDPDTFINEAEAFNTSQSWSNAEATIAFTDVCSELTRKIRKAAARDKVHRFEVKFDYINTDLNGVNRLTEVRQLLGLDAEVAVFLGDSNRAFHDALALFQLARHLQPVPYFAAMLSEYACRRQALLIVQKALQRDLFSDEQLQTIDEYCKANSDLGTRWNECVREEFGGAALLFVNPNLGVRNSGVVMPPRGEDGLFYLDMMRKAWSLPTEDWTVFRNKVAAIMFELDAKSSGYWGSRKHELSRGLTPDLHVAADLFISDAQLHRQARVAISLRKYSRANRSFPASLVALKLQPAEEYLPFGDEPFGYRVVDGRAVLWGFELGQWFKKVPTSYEEVLADEVSRNRNGRLVWWLEPVGPHSNSPSSTSSESDEK